MQNDEQLIADLAASLRQAVEYIKPESTTDNWEAIVNLAEGLLQDAAARLATIQPKRSELPVQLTIAQAERISEGLSDILCWARGFIAGRENDDDHPMGIDAVRMARGALREAVSIVRGDELTEDLPF